MINKFFNYILIVFINIIILFDHLKQDIIRINSWMKEYHNFYQSIPIASTTKSTSKVCFISCFDVSCWFAIHKIQGMDTALLRFVSKFLYQHFYYKCIYRIYDNTMHFFEESKYRNFYYIRAIMEDLNLITESDKAGLEEQCNLATNYPALTKKLAILHSDLIEKQREFGVFTK